MKSITTTAKTVEDAIEIALKELDVDRTEVEIDVVSKGKPGILGIGSEPASVKVTKGIISSLTGIGNNFSNIQIDAAVSYTHLTLPTICSV